MWDSFEHMIFNSISWARNGFCMLVLFDGKKDEKPLGAHERHRRLVATISIQTLVVPQTPFISIIVLVNFNWLKDSSKVI
jgi:hypothetical protein